MKEIIATTGAPGAIGPYSQATKAGSLVFVSGQLPIDPATGVMPEDVSAQTKQSLTNAKAIVEGLCHVLPRRCLPRPFRRPGRAPAEGRKGRD